MDTEFIFGVQEKWLEVMEGKLRVVFQAAK